MATFTMETSYGEFLGSIDNVTNNGDGTWEWSGSITLPSGSTSAISGSFDGQTLRGECPQYGVNFDAIADLTQFDGTMYFLDGTSQSFTGTLSENPFV